MLFSRFKGRPQRFDPREGILRAVRAVEETDAGKRAMGATCWQQFVGML